jgi:EAL domain-containing protein (putative c-di-GMP-specific phosphodiesterase class I)
MRICAEGVETKDQVSLLRRERCEQAQGFLFGQAMEPALIDALVTGAERHRGPRLRVVG